MMEIFCSLVEHVFDVLFAYMLEAFAVCERNLVAANLGLSKGKKVGIVGFGKIGLEVAHRLEAFDCIIAYNSRSKNPFVSYPFYSSAVELATNSNVLVLCCALNDQTRHVINREVMLALRKGGVIVNVARGAVIDEKALLRCLIEGEIGGAGLDVFENEPLVSEEFFSLDM
ncbi:Glyoxylate/hydroxypyruvate reductase HPR3 [Spatholobus suberectus]|nr:Glyoxylate/hydroxypyruvate reductase HPR3 [Spatholobus suberectus]